MAHYDNEKEHDYTSCFDRKHDFLGNDGCIEVTAVVTLENTRRAIDKKIYQLIRMWLSGGLVG